MARTRGLLPLGFVDEFAEYAAGHGWRREETKGIYEVLRMRKEGAPKPMLLFRREGAFHASIGDDQPAAEGLALQFLRSRKEKGATT